MARRGRKKGAITVEELSKRRRKEIEAAELAQANNAGKIEIQIDARTKMLVDPSRAVEFQSKARIHQNTIPENAHKVEFLKGRNWQIVEDGFWRKVGKGTSDLESALNRESYYQHRYS